MYKMALHLLQVIQYLDLQVDVKAFINMFLLQIWLFRIALEMPSGEPRGLQFITVAELGGKFIFKAVYNLFYFFL